jgi:uncharacterized membrane protein
MGKGRLEAFSDGVIAILITIMVLELKAPDGESLAALRPLLPSLLGYLLSFIYLGVYWNNHHHLLHLVTRVDGALMWANLHLLFWLSLVPFATSWMGTHPDRTAPTAMYGVVMLLAAIAFYLLQRRVVRAQEPGSALAHEIGADWKGKLSPVAYATAIGLAFVAPSASQAIYALVALWWLVPDRRYVRALAARE